MSKVTTIRLNRTQQVAIDWLIKQDLISSGGGYLRKLLDDALAAHPELPPLIKSRVRGDALRQRSSLGRRRRQAACAEGGGR